MSDSKQEETAEMFQARLGGMVSSGFTSLSLALGSKIGLFDLLAKFDVAKTPVEIAEAGNFKERYVREWLGAVVCCGIVQITEDGEKFWLPKEYRPLVSGSTPENVSTQSWFVPMLGNVVSDLESCFKKDGPPGLPQSKYLEYQEWREKMMIQQYTSDFITQVVDNVPELKDKLEKGIEICELGCGPGILSLRLAEMYPATHVFGLDMEEEAVKRASSIAREKGVANARFMTQDFSDLPTNWTDKWDFMFAVDSLHNMPCPTKAISELYRCLKPGSYALVLDINAGSRIIDNKGDATVGMMYTISALHTLPVSLGTPGGEGLGAVWGKDKTLTKFNAAGFSQANIIESKDFARFLLKK